MSLNRKNHIWSCLQQHYEEAKSLGYEIFAIVVQGSQNYDLDIYTDQYKSDIDTKAIILPSFEDFVRGSAPVSKTHVRINEEHIDIKDIRVMFEMFKKQNVNFVEILFSDYCIVNEKYKNYWEMLRSIAEQIVHCHPAQTVKTMAGMSMEKLKALCHPYPSIAHKIEKYGYDPKQLHHIIRINMFLKEYIKGKSFKICLTEGHDRQRLRDIKTGKIVFSKEDAVRMAEAVDAETNKIKNEFIQKNGSDIIDTMPYKILEDIKYQILKDYFCEELTK